MGNYNQIDIKKLIDLIKSENFSQAENLSRTIIQKFPKFIPAWKILGSILRSKKKFEEAINVSEKILDLNDKDAEELNNLANLNISIGNFDKSEKLYKTALKLNPDNHGIHNNLANLLSSLNRLDEANQSFERAIKLNPNFSEAYYNLAINFHKLKKFDDAEKNYNQSIKLKPKLFSAYNNLGNLYRELGQLKSAEKNYRKAIDLNKDYVFPYNNLGNILKKQGKIKEAEKYYIEAIKIDKNYIEPYLNLCDLLEKTNKLDYAFKIINSAKKINKKKDDLLFYESLIHFRLKNYKESENTIKKIYKKNISDLRTPNFLKLKADLFEHQKDYKNAFINYEIMNQEIQKKIYNKKYSIDTYLENQKTKLNQILDFKGTNYQTLNDNSEIQPVFIIGFPRSGTTLLDTILRGHSKICIAEEKPFVSKMLSKLGKSNTVLKIENLSINEINNLKAIYFEEVKKTMTIDQSKILIDKFPLNIVNIGIIKKIFPNSKFILSIRHPMDSVFSSWVQNFEINEAMAVMTRLDKATDLYCTSMKILKLYNERYNLKIHTIRYEDLVSNTYKEIFSVISFLGLDWEDHIINHQKTAFERNIINTPSYSQVIKPIYKSAIYRWKNYKEYLQIYIKNLKPWIDEFGYTDT